MTTIINASTSAGLVQTADTSGILQLQTANTAALTIDASQNVTLTGALQSPTINTPTINKINTSTGYSLGAGNASIMKNRIINGAVTISQYNGTSSVTPSANGYVIDRFQYIGSQASKFTFQQASGAVATTGFNNYLSCTVASAVSVGASDRFILFQPIEGYNTADLAWGTASAKTITVSFWVQSSLTGTFGACVNNGGTAYSYPFNYTISSANTWTQISVTIAGPTAGSWNTTNGASLQLIFNLGSGSTYLGTAGSWSANNYYAPTGSVSVVGTSGATFYITGVQLEVGSSATGFEYRQYGQELSLCQRYYTSGNYSMIWGSYTTGTIFRQNIALPTTQRVGPTVTLTNTTASSANAPVVATSYPSNWQLQSSSTATATNAEVTGTYTASSEL